MSNRKDDLPPLELLDGGEDALSEVEVVSGSRNPRWFAVIAVVLVAAVVAVLVRDDDSREPEPPPDSSTSSGVSQPVGGAESESVETTGSYVTGRAAEAFAAAPGTLVVLGSADRSWRVLDPSSGWVEDLPTLEGVDPDLVTPISGGLLVSEDQFSVPALLELRLPGPGVEDPIERIPFSFGAPGQLSQFVGALGAGDEVPSNLVWVVSAERGTQEPRFEARLVNRRGEPLLGPFDLAAPPLAANAVGVMGSAGGRSFIVSADGTSDLGVGTVVAGAGNYAGLVSCDESVSCVQEIVDVTTTQVVTESSFPSDAAARATVTMAQAPDGSIASLPARVGSHAPLGLPSTNLFVMWSDGRAMETTVDNPRSAPVWLPGGDALLILTGLGLVKVEAMDGALTATRIRDLSAQGSTAVFVVRAADS